MSGLSKALRTLTFIIGTTMLCLSCNAKERGSDREVLPPSPVFPTPPTSYTDPELRASYILNNIWTPYTTLDSSAFLTDAVAEQFWVNYFAIAQAATRASIASSLSVAFGKGTESFNAHVLEFAEEYLYQVNSPIYNEGLYMQVMQVADSMSILSEADRIRYHDRHAMYLKNQVGSIAADFAFTTPTGADHTLHKVEGAMTLIVFYNPGCDVCRGVMQHIDNSRILQEATSNGLRVVCISLSNDMEEWRAYLDEIPTGAMVGMDKNETIVRQSLYDIKAFPTLYLLDRDKRVIAKDPMIQQVEQIIQQKGGMQP